MSGYLKSMPSYALSIFAGIVALIPFIALQSQIRIPADAAWLIQAAEHIWNGQALSEYYFDTNPPMCFLIYLPVVWLKEMGLSTWHALQAFTVLMSVIFLLSSAYFLKKLSVSNTTSTLALLAYGFAVFVLPALEYGQKDHLIALSLFPFLLAQLCITGKVKCSSLVMFLTLIICTPLILMKPHYGLLPAAIIAHRLYYLKSLRIIFNTDFAVLAIGSVLYIGSTFLFFPDFINEVLPLSLNIYVGGESNSSIHKFSMAMAIFALCFCGASIASEKNTADRRLCIALSIMTFLSVIPYWVQGKGFTLHLIPFATLSLITLFSVTSLYCSTAISRNKIATAFIGVGILCVCFLVTFKTLGTKSHAFYRNHDLAKIVKPTGLEKSFYIESNSTNEIMQLSEYHDIEYASRFVVNWFTYHFPIMEKSEMQYYWNLTGRYFAEDLERYKPEIIMLIDIEDRLSLLHAFREHPDFQAAMQKYSYSKNYESDSIFMNSEKVLGQSSVSYKIYKRTENE